MVTPATILMVSPLETAVMLMRQDRVIRVGWSSRPENSVNACECRN
jgi:hypothetical protein